MSPNNNVGATSHVESGDSLNREFLQVVELISPEEVDSLNNDLQESVIRAMSHRKAAAFARGVGVLNPENDPIAKPVITAINGVLSRFFDGFFDRHPDIDMSIKVQILDKYKKGLEQVIRAFAGSKNQQEADTNRDNLVSNFLTILEENPDLRNLQIASLKSDLSTRMKGAKKMSAGKSREHGSRQGWQNSLGIGVIIAEALATGYAMSNGIENAAFKNGYWLAPGASYLPGGMGAFVTALGGQALARSIVGNKKDEDGILKTVGKNAKLQLGALAVAMGLTGILIGDYQMSKSALGISAATSGEVKGRTSRIGESLSEIALSNSNTLDVATETAGNTVKTIIEKEGDRGGKAGFHALKTRILTGGFTGVTSAYATDTSLSTWISELDSRKGTKVARVYSDYQNGLGKITYSAKQSLQTKLQDPAVSYADKMSAIASEYASLLQSAIDMNTKLHEKSSKSPELDIYTMLVPSGIGAFSSGQDAQDALKAIAQKLGSIPEDFALLHNTEKQLTTFYKSTIDSVESETQKAFAGTRLATNTLPTNMDLGLTFPDTKGLQTLASSPLGDFRGMTSDEAMQKVQDVYGTEVRSSVESFIVSRAAIFVSLIVVTQIFLVFHSLRRRSKNASEIEQVGKECMKQIDIIVDTLYSWTQESLKKLVSSNDNTEIMSRAFCEHIVWSWLIEVDPKLKEFAPPTYLGEQEGMKGSISKTKSYLWQLLTGDIRPDTDRRTESLYTIFQSRIKTGSLMSEKDIEDILKMLRLKDGSLITQRVQDLGNMIAAGNAEYALRSDENPEYAHYIENAKNSLEMQMFKEIAEAKTLLHESHINELQNLGNQIVSGSFPTPEMTESVSEYVDTIREKYEQEQSTRIAEIDKKYQISGDTSASEPKKKEKGWLGAISRYLGRDKKIPPVKSVSKKSQEPVLVPQDVPEKPFILVAKIASGMGTIKDRIVFHQGVLAELSTTEGRKKFTQDILGGDDSLIPESVLQSAENIGKYQQILSRVDSISDEMKTIRGQMDGVTDIQVLEGVLLELEEKISEKNTIVESQGEGFQDWMKNIVQLLNGLDTLDEHENQWNPKVESQSGTLESEKGIALQKLGSAIEQVAAQKSQQVGEIMQKKVYTADDFEPGIPVDLDLKLGRRRVTLLENEMLRVEEIGEGEKISVASEVTVPNFNEYLAK